MVDRVEFYIIFEHFYLNLNLKLIFYMYLADQKVAQNVNLCSFLRQHATISFYLLLFHSIYYCTAGPNT